MGGAECSPITSICFSYDLMLACWKPLPSERPEFPALVHKLRDILQWEEDRFHNTATASATKSRYPNWQRGRSHSNHHPSHSLKAD